MIPHVIVSDISRNVIFSWPDFDRGVRIPWEWSRALVYVFFKTYADVSDLLEIIVGSLQTTTSWLVVLITIFWSNTMIDSISRRADSFVVVYQISKISVLHRVSTSQRGTCSSSRRITDDVIFESFWWAEMYEWQSCKRFISRREYLKEIRIDTHIVILDVSHGFVWRRTKKTRGKQYRSTGGEIVTFLNFFSLYLILDQIEFSLN